MKHDVTEILREGFAQQSFDVLKHERARLNLPHCTGRLGEKVSVVAHRPMLAADGKWLARRAACDHIYAPIPCLEILVVNVTLNERPMADKFVASPLIGSDGFASIVIVFEHGIVLEARVRRGKCETARTCEKLDAAERTAWREFWRVFTQDARTGVGRAAA